MDAFSLIKWAAEIFAVAAIGGLMMLVVRLSGAPRPPSWIAMLHGLLAAGGLTLLFLALATTGLPLLGKFALALLVAGGALGTWVNLRYHVQNLELPIPTLFIHAVLAVGGVVLLLLLLTQSPAVTGGEKPFPS